MPEDPPFAASEQVTGKCLRRLKTPYGTVSLNDRNEKGEITRLDLRGVTYRDEEAIRSVNALESLTTIVADAPLVCDLLFEIIAHLPCLERISVWDQGGISDIGMLHLSSAPRLQDLKIHGSRISDAGLKAIGQIRNLIYLEVAGNELITNDGLRHFCELVHLVSLGLCGTPIDDEGLVHLAQLAELSRLYLGESKISGRGFVHLRSLKKLTSINANWSLFDDEGLAALKGFPKLDYLSLRETRVTDAGTPHLAMIPRLKEVCLHACQVTDASVRAFTQCPKLKSLYLEETGVTPEGKQAIKAILPKCVIFVSTTRENKKSNAPWEDRNYFWKHPPECLARFKLTKKRGQDLSQWATRFQLSCSCGHRQGEVVGYSLSRVAGRKQATGGDLFVGPLLFRCGKCKTVIEIIDTEHDGYHGRIGSSAVCRGKGEPDEFICSGCMGGVWQLQATVEMNEGAFDLWYDDSEIALENFFDVFQLHGSCAKCKTTTTIASFENLG